MFGEVAPGPGPGERVELRLTLGNARETRMADNIAQRRWCQAFRRALLQARAPPRVHPANEQCGTPRLLQLVLLLAVFVLLENRVLDGVLSAEKRIAPVDAWDENQVARWLQESGLGGEVANGFLQADVDGDELLDIDTIDELNGLGIDARKYVQTKLLGEIAKLRQRVSEDPHTFWEWRSAHGAR